LSAINPFLYTAGPADFNLRLVKQTKHWRHYQVDFPVVSANCYPGGEVARGEYFEPVHKEHAPLLILIHGWGNSVLPFRWMLPGLMRRGFACFILFLPFHPSRLLAEMKSHLSNLTPDEWFTFYQIAVTDVRHIIDWTTQNGLANQRQISVIGLSLGGVVG
jgi:predicted dienelactone hydrolase